MIIAAATGFGAVAATLTQSIESLAHLRMAQVRRCLRRLDVGLFRAAGERVTRVAQKCRSNSKVAIVTLVVSCKRLERLAYG